MRAKLLPSKMLAGIALFTISPTAADAQKDPAAPSKNPEAQIAKVPISAGQRYLMELYGISADEAAERLALEADVSKLANELMSSNEEDFGDVWIEHEPVYKIVVAFAGNKDRAYIRERIDPRLRRYVQIKPIGKSRKQLGADVDAIIQSLAASGIPYDSYYDHRTDKLVVEVEQDKSVATVKDLLPPKLRSEVMVRKANIPKPDQVISGAQPYDEVNGGWWYYTSSTAPLTTDKQYYNCSFAFTGKNNVGKSVVITAGHCEGPYWIAYEDGHRVQISNPIHEYYGGKYDYQVHDVTGLDTGPWVWYNNNYITIPDYETRDNNVAGYGDKGYFRVTGTRGYYDQKVGQVVCKSGIATGFTCGQITHGWYTHNGATGWIQYGNSSQELLAFAGDSGGAVFSSPTTSGDILALGVHSSSTAVYDSAGKRIPCTQTATRKCYGISMPIDYVDDQQLITIQTAQ